MDSQQREKLTEKIRVRAPVAPGVYGSPELGDVVTLDARRVGGPELITGPDGRDVKASEKLLLDQDVLVQSRIWIGSETDSYKGHVVLRKIVTRDPRGVFHHVTVWIS